MENIKPYVRDAGQHLDAEGAAIYTKAISTVLKAHLSGQNTDQYFFTADEWFASICYISKAWCNRVEQNGQTRLYGHALYGTTVVPQYRYTLQSQDGSEIVVQDWSDDPNLVLPSEQASGKTICFYVQDSTQSNQTPVRIVCE